MGESLVAPAIRKRAHTIDQRRKDAFDVLADLSIGEAQLREAKRRMAPVAGGIARWVMGVAVDLNDQAFRRAEEINNGIVDDVLTAELVPVEFRSGEMAPKDDFEWGRRFAKLPRAMEMELFLHVTPPPPAPPLKGRGV